MNRRQPLLPLLLTAALVAPACGDGGGSLDAGPAPDGGAAADASTPRPRPDAGPADPLPVPSLSNVSPNRGPETGRTRVTLRGANFIEPAEVFFGDAPATSVVVLDEVSIAATAPPAPGGARGPVTVRVVTEGGEAELPDGFTYVRELRLDAIEPARVPDEGGVQVTLTGLGFDASTLVFFDRVPLRGLSVQSETTIVGYVPALAPGRPEIRVVHPEAGVRRSDLLFVYGTPEIRAVAPGWGHVDGGDPQEAIGDGLTGASLVTVGGEAATDVAVASDGRVAFAAPRQVEGAHDVVVANDDAPGVLRGGYVAVDPNVPGAALLGATPNRVSSEGGAQVTLVGRGFDATTQVSVGGVRVPVDAFDPNALVVTLPAGLPAGALDVQVFTASDVLDGAGLITVYEPMTVDGITPDRGPASGGTEVTLTGTGFVSGVEVRIADVPLADVQVVSPTEITGRVVAGAGGVHDVVVRGADGRAVLEDAFTFEEPFEVVRVEPEAGSIAGNTYVTVLGRGFTGEAAVQFGGVDGIDPVLENGGVIGVRTQPNSSGRVDVDVQAGGQDRLPLGFEFYDPRLVTGGAWGGPIEGSVNVAVMTFQGDPIPGMVVQLGYAADARYRMVTDENGLATISSPEIRGAQTVTAGGVDVEFVTFMELNARNLTMVASPHPSVAPPDAPVFPCPPDPPPAPAVTGRIFKFKSPLDPQTRPGWQPLVQITYTQPSVFGTNPPEPATQTAFVFADGQEYRIDVMRAGTVAVYAILGDYNPETQQFEPRRMGIARSVPVAPGTVTENIDIDLDIPLTASTLLRLDNPPSQAPNPTINAVFPFLNMGSDGVIPFPPVAVQGDGAFVVDGLPAVAEDEFIYMGGSFAWDQTTGQLRNPYSLNLVETAAPFEEGVDLGPYLQMPQNVRPKAGELIVNGEFSWDQGGPTPDITTINVVDVGAAGGQCCVDINMNGQCDDGEPLMGGALPQQFNRWSIYAQGGLQSYVMPPMPAPLQAFEPPRAYGYLIQQAIAPRFDYREFIYNQFSPAFWRSWMVFDSNFAVKEETD